MSIDPRNSHIVVGDQFVSAKIERIVRSIKEYDHDLDVQWCPPGAREQGVAAFKIIYQPAGQKPYTLFHVKDEEEFDERVLLKIIANDQRVNGGVKMSDLDAFEAAQALLRQQDYEDKMAEQHDIVAHVIKSPLHKYVVNKDLVIKEGIPFNAKGL